MLAESTSRSDEQLVEIAKRRENPSEAFEAFAELQSRYGRTVLSFVGRWQADAEDLAQDVWLAVWLKMEKHFSGGSFRRWLFTLAKNMRIDRARYDALRKTEEHVVEPPEEVTTSSLETMLLEERREKLRECIAKLNDRERCIVLATLESMKTGAAAKHCQLKPDRAARIKHDATHKLQECTHGKGI